MNCQEDARQLLSELSSWLGQGLGDDKTTVDELEHRIRIGVDTLIRVESMRERERCFKIVIDAANRQNYDSYNSYAEQVLRSAAREISGES